MLDQIEWHTRRRSDNFLVGQYLTDGEIFVEVWDNNVRNGRCRSETGGTALKGNVFAEWTITLDGATCHIYKDGVELKTSVSTRSAIGTFSTPVANGSPFTVLPRNVTRTVNRLGASAWSGDQDTEGKLKYLRIYNAALTPDQVANNFNLSLTPVNQAVSGLKGTSLTTSTITPTGFTNAPTFSISPALPAGLTLNTSTGVISGTPTVTISPTIFELTATNPSNPQQTDTAFVTLDIGEALISPSLQEVDAVVGTAITPTTAFTTTGFQSGVTYSIHPTLPAGLSFDTATGVVSGTPTTVAAQATYTITATGLSTTTGTTVTDTSKLILAVAPTPTPTLWPSAQEILGTKGVELSASSELEATNFGSGVTVTYAISPALPAGLNFNTATGAVSGTPTETLAKKTFTITGSDGGNTATATLTLTVQPPPTITPEDQTVTGLVGTPIPATQPYIFAHLTSPSFTVRPDLPAGLVFDTATGVISGTPTVTLPATPFTVTASDTALFSNEISAVVTITVTETPASANTPNRTKLANTDANTSGWMGSGLILGVAGLILVVATRLHKLKHVLRSTQK